MNFLCVSTYFKGIDFLKSCKAEGNNVYFRYQLLGQITSVGIKIYDMVGEHVAELNGSTLNNSDNEVPWNLQGISTGVYFARIEAKNGETNQVEIIKVAVVK